MPIRINLLAEEQEAEEMRKRDPVKRAIFAGSALVVLVLGWIGLTQMNVLAARRDLANYDEQLKKVEASSIEAKSNQFATSEADGRIKALDRYYTNRFFWGTFLDALQASTVDSIRLVEMRSEQRYMNGEIGKLFSTNLTLAFNPPAASWKFWAKQGGELTSAAQVTNMLGSITNQPVFATNALSYTIKVTEKATNAAAKLVNATVDFSTSAWAMERTVVELRGRDYGSPTGAAIDEFARRINASPYFKQLLDPQRGFRFTERPPQARQDPIDPNNPNAVFVPFTIELVLKERILTNE